MIETQKRSILLVEDEAIIALTEATALRGSWYAVHVAHSRTEAGRERGQIRISAAVHGERARVEVRDNGVGIPAGFDPHSSPGFGLKLVDMLTQQIDGTLRIERGEGTAFILECSAG